MIDVRRRFGARQRLEVIAPGDALRELPQFDALEHVAQFGLADQDDLQELLRGGFEIRQQADLLERFRRQVLCFVDDDDDASAFGVRLQQSLVEDIDQILDAGRRPRRA